MAVFILSPEVRESIEKMRLYAEEEAHWYRPFSGQIPPGDNPKQVIQSGSIRAVFSWTLHMGVVFRQLSVSTDTEGKWPLPLIVWTLAHLYGFTGSTPNREGFVEEPGKDWTSAPHEDEPGVIVVLERTGLTRPTAN